MYVSATAVEASGQLLRRLGPVRLMLLHDPEVSVTLPPEVLRDSNGCTSAIAWGIGDAGEIVGDRCSQPFYWSEVVGLQVLPVYTPDGAGSAYSINDPAPGALALITGPMFTPKGTRGVWWRRP